MAILGRFFFLHFHLCVFNNYNITRPFSLQAITEAFEKELRRNKVQENIGPLGINDKEETVGKSLYCNKCHLIRSVESTEMIFLKGKKNRTLIISLLEKSRISFHGCGFSFIHRVSKLLKCGIRNTSIFSCLPETSISFKGFYCFISSPRL